jgi:hypothetical protein
MNYEKDVHIDETSLDVELLEQAPLAIRYGQYWSECKEEFVRAEENVKMVVANLTLEINKDPETFLGEGVKVTDVKIESAVRTHPDYIDAKERWIKAMRVMNDAEIVKNEISFTRKTALENLVQLHGQNYFAGPKVPRNLAKERYNRQKDRIDSNKRVRLNKN